MSCVRSRTSPWGLSSRSGSSGSAGGALAALVREVALVLPRCGVASPAPTPTAATLVRRVEDRCGDPLAALDRRDVSPRSSAAGSASRPSSLPASLRRVDLRCVFGFLFDFIDFFLLDGKVGGDNFGLPLYLPYFSRYSQERTFQNMAS